MNREDLGKMLEGNLGWPALSGGGDEAYERMVDAALQRGAEGFWNDVVDELRRRMEYRYNIMREVIRDPCEWLEYQKIKED